MAKSFKDYLDSLSEDDSEIKDLYDSDDDCCDDEEDDEEDDEVSESAQVQLDLLKQIQPKLAQAPLSVLKQILKRLETASDE